MGGVAAMKLSAKQLEREASKRAGCVQLRYARATKLLVGVYRSDAAGIDTDDESPWSAVCEEHGALCSSRTRAEASSLASQPQEWCDDCRRAQLVDAREPLTDLTGCDV